MENIILDEINKIKDDYPRVNKLQDYYLFSLICFIYFYNNGQFDYSVLSNCFVDGRNDGGIDLITTEEKNGIDNLVMIQCKNVNSIENTQDIIDIFTKMDQTIEDFKNERIGKYNKILKKNFKEQRDKIENIPINYSLVLFHSADPTEEVRYNIRKAIENIESLLKYEISIFYKNEIESQICSIKQPTLFVKEDKIQIARDDGVINNEDTGLLVNIYANSLRDLYDKHRDRGLFEQNFRYYIRNKKIDSSIVESLENLRNEFWYLNNGIIIGCKDFFEDGNIIRLYDFSIINGCQTTTLIGEYKGKNENLNFKLPCKIIKPKKEEDYYSFISRIAEASNSQKPISDKDLKANKKEMRNLQKELQEYDPKIYLEIKRGEKLISVSKRRNIDKWQYIKNDTYGQIILSFHLQQPGTARSSKSKIFSNESLYTKIFHRSIDKQNIIDTLLIINSYENYMNFQLAEDKFMDKDHESVGTNGKYIITSIVGFLIKIKQEHIDIRKINDGEKVWEEEIQKDCLTGNLFYGTDIDKQTKILNGLFNNIIYEVYSLYKNRMGEEKTVSNFFKTDEKYQNVILKHIVSRMINNEIEKKRLFDDYLKIFR